MRIALDQHTEVGTRTGRVLLAEAGLEKLGLVDKQRRRGSDPRVEAVSDLSTYDVYVTDADTDTADHLTRALDAGVSCVLWTTDGTDLTELGAGFAERGRTLLVGANLGHGIAATLAAHEIDRNGEVLDVMYAWTEPGKPRRRGEAIPFPDPVGPRWGKLRPSDDLHRAYVAPVLGEWAGAMAKVTTGTTDGVIERIVGVADLAIHLEALALAAGAITAVDFPPGLTRPSERPFPYLGAALRAGLDVATYTVTHQP